MKRSLVVLVAGEVALSSCLLLTGAVVVQGVVRSVRQTDFDPTAMVAAGWELRPITYPQDADVLQFSRGVLDQLSADARLTASLTTVIPGFWARWSLLELEGQDYERLQDREQVRTVSISPGFFESLGSSLTRGRDFVGRL